MPRRTREIRVAGWAFAAERRFREAVMQGAEESLAPHPAHYYIFSSRFI